MALRNVHPCARSNYSGRFKLRIWITKLSYLNGLSRLLKLLLTNRKIPMCSHEIQEKVEEELMALWNVHPRARSNYSGRFKLRIWITKLSYLNGLSRLLKLLLTNKQISVCSYGIQEKVEEELMALWNVHPCARSNYSRRFKLRIWITKLSYLNGLNRLLKLLLTNKQISMCSYGIQEKIEEELMALWNVHACTTSNRSWTFEWIVPIEEICLCLNKNPAGA